MDQTQKPQEGIIAEDKGGNFTLVPAGTFPARCVSVVHIGTYAKMFKGKSQEINEVRFTWEIPSQLHVFKEGEAPKPFTISATYTLSLNAKSNLYKMLKSWLGADKFENPANSEKVKMFDVSKMAGGYMKEDRLMPGSPCLIQIEHTTKEGTTDKYANVVNVMKLDKSLGVVCAPQVNESFVFSYAPPMEEFLKRFNKLTDKMKTKIQGTKEYKQKVAGMSIPSQVINNQSQGNNAAPNADDDDLPF